MTESGSLWAARLGPLLFLQPTFMLVAYRCAPTRPDAVLVFCLGMMAVICWLAAVGFKVKPGASRWLFLVLLGTLLLTWAAAARGDDQVPFYWRLAAFLLQACLAAAWVTLCWTLWRRDGRRSLPVRLASYGALVSFAGLAFNALINFIVHDPWASAPAWHGVGIWEAVTHTPEPMLIAWGVWVTLALVDWGKYGNWQV